MRKVINKIKSFQRNSYKPVIKKYFKWQIGETKFCVFSNDCWGAELYKLLDRPFNTPFIGLMLMSPCYLKLLENPKYYLHLPINFKKESKYPSMNEINSGTSFPLGILGDSGIEIQFLHYGSESIAKDKWDRRVERIDWEHLFIKYDCGKDYADMESVQKFLELPYKNKLVFGKEDFGINDVYMLGNYALDAVVQFKNCFLSFNPIKWISGKFSIEKAGNKTIRRIAFKYL